MEIVKYYNEPQNLKNGFVEEINNFKSALKEEILNYSKKISHDVRAIVFFNAPKELVEKATGNRDEFKSFDINKKVLIAHYKSPVSGSTEETIFNGYLNNVVNKIMRLIEEGNYIYLTNVVIIFIYDLNFSELESKLNSSNNNFFAKQGFMQFFPSKPLYSIDQVVLSEELKGEIETALNLLKYRKKIYDDWGFGKIDPKPRAILNFYGPPGTGKTMTAHAIAKELGLNILALNYADIESKYVGDAPKNLVKAFKTAEENNCLLFFDEADSFLGKRIQNVQSSSDQAVNSLRSQMFILLEQFNGIVVFATNLLGNYDRAFESRIFRHIKLDLPNKEERRKIIEKTVPKVALKVPLNNTLLDELAKISDGFSGREIKNAILEGLTLSATANKDFLDDKDLLIAFENMNKQRENIDKEKKKSQATKKSIEEKIKASLKKDIYKRLLEVASLAAYADGSIALEERESFDIIAKGMGIEFEFPESRDMLPTLKYIFKDLKTKEDKLRALELTIKIIGSDGKFLPEEIEFIKNVCNLCGIKNEAILDKILKYTENFAKENDNWKVLKTEILGEIT